MRMPLRLIGEKLEYKKDFQRPASMLVTEEDLLNIPDASEFRSKRAPESGRHSTGMFYEGGEEERQFLQDFPGGIFFNNGSSKEIHTIVEELPEIRPLRPRPDSSKTRSLYIQQLPPLPALITRTGNKKRSSMPVILTEEAAGVTLRPPYPLTPTMSNQTRCIGARPPPVPYEINNDTIAGENANSNMRNTSAKPRIEGQVQNDAQDSAVPILASADLPTPTSSEVQFSDTTDIQEQRTPELLLRLSVRSADTVNEVRFQNSIYSAGTRRSLSIKSTPTDKLGPSFLGPLHTSSFYRSREGNNSVSSFEELLHRFFPPSPS